MPFGEVKLIPGINLERTPTLLEAGYAQGQLIRFLNGLAQKYGGWSRFYSSVLAGTPRDLHAWQDLNEVDHLAVGTTSQIYVLTGGNPAAITPQTLTTNFSPNFTTTVGSATVQVTDSNVNNVTVFDTIIFNTPVSVGGIVLSGIYPIVEITGADSYDITAATVATGNVSNGGAVPAFTTTNMSESVSVALANHGLSVGNTVVFPIATTGNGVTIQGAYDVVTVTDANDFVIYASALATASSSFNMNSGNAELVYYIALGPNPSGSGYGLGSYGGGGYGIGQSAGSVQTGTPITATDYTQDNWGQILLSCPANGGIYSWDPTGGFQNSMLVASAPPYNTGMFISTAQQVLVTYGSTVTEEIGIIQDPLWVQWSTVGDFTNFVPTTADQAGGYRIPNGSKCVGGMSVANQNLIWTDEDCWAMSYQGPPFVYGFNKIGAGAGLASSHAAQALRGSVFWMGPNNFFSLTGNGVNVIPCPVWDVVFQNLNTSFLQNVRAMPNTPFNEVGWLYPSASSANGENDSYVKFNMTEQGNPWDYGPVGALPRSAWIDLNVFGPPISASPQGLVYSQETGADADGQPLVSSFISGYFVIGEGEDFSFVDMVIPDMKFGLYSGPASATVQFTFYVVNFPGDTPVQYGPYAFNSTTEYIPVRFRGRQMAIGVTSDQIGAFFRLGLVRYRWAPCGRR
jgi:hypothetical protein